MRHYGLLGGLAAGAILLSACGGEAPLAQRDPRGYEACQQLSTVWSQQAGARSEVEALLVTIPQAAIESTTEAIRSTTKISDDPDLQPLMEAGGLTLYEVDRPALAAACRDNGVDVPPEPSPSP